MIGNTAATPGRYTIKRKIYGYSNMSYSKSFLAIACLAMPLLSPAIIYRHDVPLTAFTTLGRDQSFDCIGMIYNTSSDTDRITGSCVLISDQYVLTAWHVFKYGKDFDSRQYKMVFGGQRYDIADYEPYAQQGHDIVLVKLAGKVKNISFAVLDTTQSTPGDTLTMVGYGYQRPSDMLDHNVGIGIKTAAHNITDSLGGNRVNDVPTKLYADFDGPVPGAGVAVPLEGMINGGDSGGGLFVQRNGQYRLIGIASGSHVTLNSQRGFDGSVSYWAYTPAYYSWIKQSLRK
jgi:hypothetical protein